MKLYTTKEVSEILRLKRMSVWSKIQTGEIKAKKIGKDYRITEEALKEYMEGINDIQKK